MDTKWMAILCVGIAVAMFAPLAIMEYGKSNCRIEAIRAGIDADKIKTACDLK